MVDGKTEYGNFHEATAHKENFEKAATEGSFEMLAKRVGRINASIDTIIEY